MTFKIGVNTTAERSAVMSRIRSKDTKPELRLRGVLEGARLPYEAHPDMFGKPDLYLPKYAMAVFVHGCFWHRCPKHYKRPGTNQAFWDEKVVHNVARHRLVTYMLKKQGFHVLTIWEHSLKDVWFGRRFKKVINKLNECRVPSARTFA